MRLVTLLVCGLLYYYSPQLPIGGITGVAPSGGTSKSFRVATSGDAAGPIATTQTTDQTTTANDLLYLVWTAQTTGCNDAIRPVITSTGSDNYLPLPIATGGSVISIKLDTGGSAYTSPSCSTSGGGGTGFTCSAGQTGGVVDTLNLTGTGANYTGIPNITISDGGPGTGATAHVTAMGLAGTTGCMSHWYVKQAAGTTNNHVIVTTATSFGYPRAVLFEAYGTDATNPLDQVFAAYNASANSLTSSNFTTTQANEILFWVTSIELLTNTWSGVGTTSACAAGIGCIKPAGATPSLTAISGEYNIVTTTLSGLNMSLGGTSGSQEMKGLGASFK